MTKLVVADSGEYCTRGEEQDRTERSTFDQTNKYRENPGDTDNSSGLVGVVGIIEIRSRTHGCRTE
jgi:hypothetical protein